MYGIRANKHCLPHELKLHILSCLKSLQTCGYIVNIHTKQDTRSTMWGCQQTAHSPVTVALTDVTSKVGVLNK